MNKFYVKSLALLIAGLITCNAQAQTQPQATQITATQNSQLAESTQKAQQWHLQPEEWQRYQELMDGPLGIYSPNLDPLTALGISARSDEERRRYAELQVAAEIQRVERELAYQRAYDDAFERMYPNLLPIDFGAMAQASIASASIALPSEALSNGRTAVFIRDNCAPCDAEVLRLQNAGVSFDLYMVGSGENDAVIRQWASKAGIESQKVFARTITLNHDSGRWEALAMTGDLPAVIKEVGGKWQRQ